MRHLLLPLGLIFCLMAAFLSMTPLAADDYSYYFATGSFSNIIPAEITQYFSWTGRSVAHVIGRVLVLSPAAVHVVSSAAAFTGMLLCAVIFIHGRGWQKKTTFFHLLLLFALLWISVPAFGTAFFWRLGVANYLWPLFFLLCFMARYRLLTDGPLICPSRTGTALLCLLGLLAGWGNENSSILAFFFAAGALLLQRRRKVSVPLRLWLPPLCVLAGFALLVCAPGNYQRIAQESEHVRQVIAMGLLEKMFYYFDKMIMALGLYFPAPLAAALLFWRCRRQQKKTGKPCSPAYGMGLICAGMAVLATGALFLSPSYALRTFTSITVFYSMAACAFFVAGAPFAHQRRLTLCLSLCMAGLVGYEVWLFADNQKVQQARLAAYAAAPAGDVTIPRHFPHIDKFFFIGGDIKDMDAYAPLVAKYYHVRTIRTE